MKLAASRAGVRKLLGRCPRPCLALLALGGWLATGRAAGPGDTPRERVAMMDFTSDDGLLRSAAGAAQWSLLVQDAAAPQETAVDWIERAQLGLAADELNVSAAGFTSADGALRIGRWLRADLAILGRFTRDARGDGHSLQLEVIDLNRADTLATRTVHLDGDSRAAIVPDPALIPAAVTALRAALSDARAKLARTAGQKVVAPLFFQNADPSPRLNRVENDLIDTLAESAGRTADVRVLRFSRAEESRGEAELAVLGLAESDAEAWQQVADLYVWGSYHELPAAGAVLAQTPVEIEWNQWDGVGPVRQTKEKTTVAQLPALAQRLTDECLEAARRVPALRSTTTTARGEIARSLTAQGERLEETLASHGAGQRAAFVHTPEGQSLARQQRRLFEAACFFAPSDRTAQLGHLRARWDGFPAPQQRLPLLDLWRRSNDLADYAARFGQADPTLARANVDADAYLLARLHDGEDQIHVPGSEPNLPVDATDANLAAWHKALDARFTRDALAYARATPGEPPSDPAMGYTYAVWMEAALRYTHDAAAAARVVETIWPRYRPFYQQNAIQEDGRYGIGSGLVAAVQQLYAGLHQPARADAILAGPSPVAHASSGGPAVAEADLPAATLRPPLPRLTPGTRALRFPEGTAASAQARPWLKHTEERVVQSLAVGSDDILWISSFRGEAELSSPRDAQQQELWCFDPADDGLRALSPGELSRETPVTSLLPQADGLWLTVGLTGVWKYNPAQEKTVRKYTVADGLLTADMDGGVCTAGGQLYFAGHEDGVALLNRFDAAGQNWLRVDLPTSANHAAPARIVGSEPPLPPPRTQICTFEHWLLVRLGESWTLVDTQSRRTRSLREALPPALTGKIASFAETTWHPGMATDGLPLPRTRPCTADARGFWLAVDGKLVQFDPVHPETAKSWLLPDELAEGVTALAGDGENLWLTGPAGVRRLGGNGFAGSPRLGREGKGFVAVLHESDGQWRGGFELPAPVGCIALAHQAVYVDQQMCAQPVLEIDKDATLAPRRALTSLAAPAPPP